MANLKVVLLLRAKTPNQERPYLKPALAANGNEVNSTTPPDNAAPTPTSAKPVPSQKGTKNTPPTVASANDAAITSRPKAAKRRLDDIADTFVSARDTEIIDQLITATRALIADGGPVTKPCVQLKVKAGDQIEKLRQRNFDTWAAIGANLSSLRTASKTNCRLNVQRHRSQMPLLSLNHYRIVDGVNECAICDCDPNGVSPGWGC
jgi:hypothetical protein